MTFELSLFQYRMKQSNFASDLHSMPGGLNLVPIGIMKRISSEADIVERA